VISPCTYYSGWTKKPYVSPVLFYSLVKKKNYNFFWSFEYIWQKDNDKIEQFNCHILLRQQDLRVDYTGLIVNKVLYKSFSTWSCQRMKEGERGGDGVILEIHCPIKKNSSLSSICQWINHAKLYKKTKHQERERKSNKGQWLTKHIVAQMHPVDRLGGTHNVCMTILGSHPYSNF